MCALSVRNAVRSCAASCAGTGCIGTLIGTRISRQPQHINLFAFMVLWLAHMVWCDRAPLRCSVFKERLRSIVKPNQVLFAAEAACCAAALGADDTNYFDAQWARHDRACPSHKPGGCSLQHYHRNIKPWIARSQRRAPDDATEKHLNANVVVGNVQVCVAYMALGCSHDARRRVQQTRCACTRVHVRVSVRASPCVSVRLLAGSVLL